jgi:hypothetical protein
MSASNYETSSAIAQVTATARSTHANVAVHDEADAEEGVEGRVRRRANHERGGSRREERGGQETLEGPVVAPVRLVRGWERQRIVHRVAYDRPARNVAHRRLGRRARRRRRAHRTHYICLHEPAVSHGACDGADAPARA